MPGDLPCLSYMALYIVSMHIINTNSRTSTHWKLNTENGKVQAAVVAGISDEEAGDSTQEDPVMSILTNRVILHNGEWRLDAESDDDSVMYRCTDRCRVHNERTIDQYDHFHPVYSASYHTAAEETSGGTDQSPKPSDQTESKMMDQQNATTSTSSASSSSTHGSKGNPKKKTSALDCGKPVNVTEFDHLRGIANRNVHPHLPEPEVAKIFKKKGSRSPEVDMNELERRLKKNKKEKPKSPQVYNQIGNFWRIKGNTQMSIECFRKALSISPSNPDVLLNLARVLFNLQYLDDAIDLTQRSLELQSPDQNSWLQHFTLGEIFKAYGRYHEAAVHFRHTLDLNTGFQPAQAHLREMEVNPDGTVTYYTLFIILFLVLGVLCGILTSIDGNFEELGETMKTQRHFNRAMAMRSIKLGINPKVIRMRKQGYNG